MDALGADQREVGLAHQLVLGAQLERLGDAGGHRERHAVLARLRGGAQALGELHRAVGAGGRQRDRELVAADAIGAVAGALGRADGLGERLQALVAGLVAAGVVDRLEVVEVDQHERERRVGAADALELAREVFVERAVVAQAGERVRDGDLRQPGRARRRAPRRGGGGSAG